MVAAAAAAGVAMGAAAGRVSPVQCDGDEILWIEHDGVDLPLLILPLPESVRGIFAVEISLFLHILRIIRFYLLFVHIVCVFICVFICVFLGGLCDFLHIVCLFYCVLSAYSPFLVHIHI